MDMTILKLLEKVEDPRVERTKVYDLIEILFLVLSSVVSGYSTWEDIEAFGEAKLDWLRKFLPYESGIPSHDTINRVMSRIKPKSLEKCLIDWTSMNITLPSGAIISIDGKSIRRSVSRQAQQTKKAEGGKQAVHMLHAWCSNINMCLAQQKVESKSNEITDLPELLSLLDVEGCVITTDSLNCQKATVEAITSGGADYVISVKANQPTLMGAIKEAFEQVEIPENQSLEMEEKSHGRSQEARCEVLCVQVIEKSVPLDLWAGIRTIVRTTSIRKEPFKEAKEEVRYHISSLELDAKKLYTIIRGHWAVENNLHWMLDVCFQEDMSRKRDLNAAANFSFIRKMAINFLNHLQTSKKCSMPNKMTKCALNDKTRETCLGIDF